LGLFIFYYLNDDLALQGANCNALDKEALKTQKYNYNRQGYQGRSCHEHTVFYMVLGSEELESD
jgi:hypothetical protein